MVGSMPLFSRRDLSVRRVQFARDAGPLAHPAGRRRRAGDPAVADHPARRLPQAAAWHDDLDLRHGRGHRPGDRPGARRLLSELYSWRWAFYGLVPVGIVVLHRPAAQHAARPAAAPRAARLDRLSEPLGGDLVRAARAVARPAARLVRIAGDLDRDLRRRARLLYLRRAQPDRGAAVPQPAPAARPQLRAGPAAGRRVRDAERHADGAAAAAAASSMPDFPTADRRGPRGARRRRHDRLFRRDVSRQARSADRHGASASACR